MNETPETQAANRDKMGRFLPGVSGNPSGPARGYSQWGAVLRKIGDAQRGQITLIGADGTRRTKRLQTEDECLRYGVSLSMYAKALAGDVHAAQWIADREDGKPKQTVEIEQDNSAPQKLIIGGREIQINV